MNALKPRTVLVGAGPTALAALESLLAATQVAALVRNAPADDPVLALAARAGVPVVSDLSLASLRRTLADLRPDCAAISSYNRIVGADLLALCPFVNVHYSPLPRYRGRANVNWAILNGEPCAAISIHAVAAGLDAGNILFQRLVPIGADATVTELYEQLNAIEREHLGATVRAYLGGLQGAPQREAEATYCCARTPEDGEIDWSEPAMRISRLVRALQPPYPNAYTFLECRRLRILAAAPVEGPAYVGRIPGRVAAIDREAGTVDVLAGEGLLRVSKVAWEDEPPRQASSVITSTRETLGLQNRQLLARIALLERRLGELAVSAGAGRAEEKTISTKKEEGHSCYPETIAS